MLLLFLPSIHSLSKDTGWHCLSDNDLWLTTTKDQIASNSLILSKKKWSSKLRLRVIASILPRHKSYCPDLQLERERNIYKDKVIGITPTLACVAWVLGIHWVVSSIFEWFRLRSVPIAGYRMWWNKLPDCDEFSPVFVKLEK